MLLLRQLLPLQRAQTQQLQAQAQLLLGLVLQQLLAAQAQLLQPLLEQALPHLAQAPTLQVMLLLQPLLRGPKHSLKSSKQGPAASQAQEHQQQHQQDPAIRGTQLAARQEQQPQQQSLQTRGLLWAAAWR